MAAGVVRWGERDWGMVGVMEKRLQGGGGEGKRGEWAGCGCECDELDEGVD